MAYNIGQGANNRKSKRPWLIVLPIVLLVLIGAFVARRSAFVEGSMTNMPIFVVREGPLLISVVESGTISAREQEIIKSEVEGQTQILWLIPEGENVKKGDLLVQLDSSRLEDQLIDQQIMVQNAEAAFINARETLGVVKSQAQSDINRAKLDYQFAVEDLEKYTEGDYPSMIKQIEARITLAETDLARAETDIAAQQRLFEKEFASELELELAKRSHKKAELDLELSIDDMALLKNFTYKRNMTQFKSDIEETNMALDRAKLKASADCVQAEATLSAKQSEYGRQQGKLDKMAAQIEKTKMYAPTDGLVVYATTAGGGRHGGMSRQEPLEEGQMVRERQEIIHLPTVSAVMARISIHESNLSKVRPGLGVSVTVDALPGKTFSGHIESIAPLPDAQSAWMNPDLKVYAAEVNIEGDGTGLRTGMSCQAEIMIERHENAVYVPVQSVMLVKGEPTVFLPKGNDIEERQVEIGLDNNRMIHIAAGLSVGESVLMSPPLASGGIQNETSVAESFVEAAPVQRGDQYPHPEAGQGRDRERSEDMSNEERGQRRGGRSRGNMTPEQMQEMRKRFENMSDEERQQMRQRYQNSGNQRRGGQQSGGEHTGASPHSS